LRQWLCGSTGGGVVFRTDPDGKEWELYCGGLRNAYDIAFNADGELFTYDSDMERDLGSPWYRPRRLPARRLGGLSVLHAIILGIVQGLSEFLPISSSGHLLIVPWLFGWEELIEPGPQVAFGRFRRDVTARREQATDRLGEQQLVAQAADDGGIGLLGQNPARARAGGRCGRGHVLNLGPARRSNNGQRVVIPPRTGARHIPRTSRSSRTPP